MSQNPSSLTDAINEAVEQATQNLNDAMAELLEAEDVEEAIKGERKKELLDGIEKKIDWINRDIGELQRLTGEAWYFSYRYGL